MLSLYAAIRASQIAEVKSIYKQKHPGAFWVDFGDFSWSRMSNIKVSAVFGWAIVRVCSCVNLC